MEKEQTPQESETSAAESRGSTGTGGMGLTSSVIWARDQFSKSEPISAAALVGTILRNHGEYADGKISDLQLPETRLKRTVSEWLEEVQQLFDSKQIAMLSKSDSPPMLHGRLVILGLSLLESKLYSRLEANALFTKLIQEIEEKPFEEILTDRGRFMLSTVGDKIPDSVPSHPDDPLRSIEEDRLGRAAFARFLAKRIDTVRSDSGAYSIHVYGPWGSGKSTLLNFIKAELESSKCWLVIEFNAWRNQHIHPPWWSLLDNMFQRSKRELSWHHRLNEYWWRLNTGRTDYILGFIILVWIVALFVFPVIYRSGGETLSSWGDAADSLGKIVAVIITLWGIAIAISRSMFFGSAKGAKTYVELTRDPMEAIKKRFTNLVKHVQDRGKRMVVFIDDLDRCQADYVIELLEGIQTLFKEKNTPVVFIIAADRHWLNACYEQNYPQFKLNVCEPGKTLGVLFLEKVFQFSTPVPGIPTKLKEAFWESLIKVNEQKTKTAPEEIRKRAKEKVLAAKTEGGILRLIDESRNQDFYEQRAIREEAIVRLAAPEVIERTEHALLPFAGLLDPNPRAMKRLVNTYSVNRALATLSDIDIDRDRLALWSILSLRWPVLAEYLEKNPGKTGEIVGKNSSALSDEVAELCNDENVISVLQGIPTSSTLDESVVRKCARLRT
jgi:Cdc6-like AAA superfamily ATPase